MLQDIFDRLPSGTLDNFDEFREKNYNYTYLCKNCNRSFDSREEMDSCKFCSGEIIELRSVKREKESKMRSKKTAYRYFCPTCERNFTTTEKLSVCSNCRTDYLHVYTWNMLRRRERVYIKIQKALQSLFVGKETKKESRQINFSMPKMKFLNKPKEELPTY